MKIRVKRVYELPDANDGKRILVDRLWPRGLAKDKANIDYWAKEIAPSTVLRKWYNHDDDKWEEFKNRYFDELNNNQPSVDELLSKLGDITTLVFSSRESKLNNAHALKEYLVSYASKR